MPFSRLKIASPEALPATVLTVSLEQPAQAGASLRLMDETSGHEVCAQVDALNPRQLYLPVNGLDAGAKRSFRVLEGTGGQCGPQGVEVSEDGTSLCIDVHGERFTRYHYTSADAPARPYFYPILAPGGLPVTRNYPMADVDGEMRDHPHHRSVWAAHGDVNGTDNWSEEKGHGRTEHVSFEGHFGGPVAGGFREKTRWVSNQGEPLLDETRDVRAYAVDGPYRVLDLALQLTPTNGDVTFGDTKEGGLISVRVATSMDVDKAGTIHNSEGGVNEDGTWGKQAAWCDYYGPVQGRTLGITLMDHPSNPRFPTYWHVRNYGLMTANPFGLSYYHNDKSKNGSLVLPVGQTSTWKYRLLVHEGTTEVARVSSQYTAFAAVVAGVVE
jgi:hypothetical protein